MKFQAKRRVSTLSKDTERWWLLVSKFFSISCMKHFNKTKKSFNFIGPTTKSHVKDHTGSWDIFIINISDTKTFFNYIILFCRVGVGRSTIRMSAMPQAESTEMSPLPTPEMSSSRSSLSSSSVTVGKALAHFLLARELWQS